MRVRFAKMHGLGNDFVVVDATAGAAPTPAQARVLGDRRRGVGCDQILVAVPSTRAECVIGMQIFNADGSSARQCGNGVRCFALFARDRGLAGGDSIAIETAGGVVTAAIDDDERVCVDLEAPRLEPAEIPFRAERRAAEYRLDLGGREVTVGAASMGNPHAVLRVEDVASAPVAELGPRVQGCGRFPDGVNVGFVQVLDSRHVRLRVYERGVGETLACGSGACAAVVVGRVQGRLDEEVDVELPGGRLAVAWCGEGAPVRMCGPATRVFEGEIEL